MLKNNQLAEITGGEIIAAGIPGVIIRLLTDSRKLLQPANSLFIAVDGERHDGHKFIRDVYDKGVRNFIVEKETSSKDIPGATIILVANAVTALQKLGAWKRRQFHIPVIGITGSNGKTVVKEWLNNLLTDDFVIVRSPRSYNSQIGVPLSTWNMEDFHSLGIFEAGISQPGEMKQLEEVIRPTIGVISNVREAHLENFKSSQQLADEKIKLFGRCEKLVYSADQDVVVKSVINSGIDPARQFAWYHDTTSNSDKTIVGSAHLFIIREQRSTPLGTEISADWMNQEVKFSFAFADEASIENCITCIVTLLAMGTHPDVVQSRLERLLPLSMRLEILNGVNQCTLINDAYSSDLHSLEIALDFMHANSQQQNKIAILSDILQTGIPPEQLYRRVNALLEEKNIQRLIGIGSDITDAKNSFKIKGEFFASTSEFLQKKNQDDFAAMSILIKGARDFRFEQITSWLQENTHDTVLEIDLSALSHNLNYFRSLLKPETKVMVMVKAFGYGSGAEEVASLLEFNKVDALAVAYTDEGVALRKSGISLPIVVMNPELSSLPTLIRHKLEPELYTFNTIDRFIHALEVSGFTGEYHVHIKLDTGMHRLGFEPADLEKLLKLLHSSAHLKVVSVFTHLAASEESRHDDFTRTQLSLFEKMSDELRSSLGYSFLRHALNTGGIQRFPEGQFEMVRLGIGLYGVAAHGDDQHQLKTVSSLKTVISQVKTIEPGESVGYGRKFIATKRTTIAIIPLGYADGLRRSLSNGIGSVLVTGKRAPIIGNVCMDMTMVDVTGIPCSEGDAVLVFGDGLPLTEIAEKSGTIAYDILTSISRRVKRVYIQE